MTVIAEVFGKPKAITAMAHFPPMSGQPLHDSAGGIQALLDAVGRDVDVLARSGVDAVMFSGVRPSTVGGILGVVDGCIVGTSRKRDGITWNAVDRNRVGAPLEAAEVSGSWLPSNTSRLVAAPADTRGGA